MARWMPILAYHYGADCSGREGRLESTALSQLARIIQIHRDWHRGSVISLLVVPAPGAGGG